VSVYGYPPTPSRPPGTSRQGVVSDGAPGSPSSRPGSTLSRPRRSRTRKYEGLYYHVYITVYDERYGRKRRSEYLGAVYRLWLGVPAHPDGGRLASDRDGRGVWMWGRGLRSDRIGLVPRRTVGPSGTGRARDSCRSRPDPDRPRPGCSPRSPTTRTASPSELRGFSGSVPIPAAPDGLSSGPRRRLFRPGQGTR